MFCLYAAACSLELVRCTLKNIIPTRQQTNTQNSAQLHIHKLLILSQVFNFFLLLYISYSSFFYVFCYFSLLVVDRFIFLCLQRTCIRAFYITNIYINLLLISRCICERVFIIIMNSVCLYMFILRFVLNIRTINLTSKRNIVCNIYICVAFFAVFFFRFHFFFGCCSRYSHSRSIFMTMSFFLLI